MCLSPIDIINPTKYVSLLYRDPYMLQVPCGKCAECQSSMSAQWQFRTYIEFKDCLHAGGFVQFDTLTYSNTYLPHISDFFPLYGINDFSCFSKNHIQLFFKKLRQKLSRAKYDVKIRYFVSSEYGTDETKTHRPHYHILFFVYGKIDPVVFSDYVSQSWLFGRTDGYPYKSTGYVNYHNTIKTNTECNIIRACSYVTKYVQKSCQFQEKLNKRISKLIHATANYIAPENSDVWLESYACRRLRLEITRLVNQFHLQSLYYGGSYLADVDLLNLEKLDSVIMPSSKLVKQNIAIPQYYKRKLFYDLIEVDSTKTWQLNDLGRKWKLARRHKLQSQLADRFSAVCYQYNLDYDCEQLADYVYNVRGRIRGPLPESIYTEKLSHIDLYNYITPSDKEELKRCGLSTKFIGNSQLGYNDSTGIPFIPLKQFIKSYVMLYDNLEKQLNKIYFLLASKNDGKQRAFSLKQELQQKWKPYLHSFVALPV